MKVATPRRIAEPTIRVVRGSGAVPARDDRQRRPRMAGGPRSRRRAAVPTVVGVDTAELLRLRSDDRAALLLVGLRGDW